MENETSRGGSVESTATARSSTHVLEITGVVNGPDNVETSQDSVDNVQLPMSIVDVVPTGTRQASSSTTPAEDNHAEFDLETWLSLDEVSSLCDMPYPSSPNRQPCNNGPPIAWLSLWLNPSRTPSGHSRRSCPRPYPRTPPTADAHRSEISDIISTSPNTTERLLPRCSRAHQQTRLALSMPSSPWQTLLLRPPRARVCTWQR